MRLQTTSGRFPQPPPCCSRRWLLAALTAAAVGYCGARLRRACAHSTGRAPRSPRPAARAPAAPVGKLAPRGCTAGTGHGGVRPLRDDRHDPVLGRADPDLGLLVERRLRRLGDRPGPLLVVNQGDRSAITLHNAARRGDVSLALPGQAATAFTGTAGDDTTGVADRRHAHLHLHRRPGRARSSTRRATRANGARQVAMGLAGALVVLPADGSAYGAQPGYPATTYDDDGVLVLSEIDPALNANPNTLRHAQLRARSTG